MGIFTESVSAIFMWVYMLSVEVYPLTIDAEDPNAPVPGVVGIVCATPDDSEDFSFHATATAEDWRFKRWRGRWNGG